MELYVCVLFDLLSTQRTKHKNTKNKQRGTKEGLAAQGIIKSGGLVSNSVMVGLLRKTLAGTNGGWLLDGYPRSLEQANSLVRREDHHHHHHQNMSALFFFFFCS